MKAFYQMKCSGLTHLEVVVMERQDQDWETTADILESLDLPQLTNLQSIHISFGVLPSVDVDAEIYVSPSWHEMEKAWTPVEAKCSTRNITCVIEHPLRIGVGGDYDEVEEDTQQIHL